MKQRLTVLLIVFISTIQCYSQWLPLDPMGQIYYAYEGYHYKRMIIQDSTLYTTRHGGLEGIDMNDYAINYNWLNYYPIFHILHDTGSQYIYVVQYDSIMRFNSTTQQHENIWPDSLQIRPIADIDVAPNGNVWAGIIGTNEAIGIYDGQSWEIFDFPQNIYGGPGGIHVHNDTMAYIFMGASRFLSFHNGIFDTIYIDFDHYVKDWCIDPAGNIWAARGSDLIYISNGNLTIYDTTNTPIGSDEFLNLELGSDGHLWTCGDSKDLLEFDGTSWTIHTLPVNFPDIENFILDEQSLPWVIIHKFDGRQLCKYDGMEWIISPIPFMPLQDVKSIGLKTQYNSHSFFATDEGFFMVSTMNQLHSFKSNSDYPFANDIRCFTDNDPAVYAPTYGTNSGIVNLPGFDNGLLPNSTINDIAHDNGTYYIATDSGLVAFNGILYNTINMSNSPLPSNKITFVTTGNINWCNETGGLYIGTDKGLAIFKNAQWLVYDSTNIPITDFYVSGILPPCDDDGTYVSTYGHGMIKVYPNGDFEQYNSSNGLLNDDTLHYVRFMFLGDCGSFIVAGTQNHGIAYAEIWYPEYFEYVTDYNGVQLTNSTMAVNGNDYQLNLIATDSMYFYLSPCGSVENPKVNKQLTWYQQGSKIKINIPETLNGNGSIAVLDITGRNVMELNSNIQSKIFSFDIDHLKTGIYIVKIQTNRNSAFCKILVSN